MDARDSWVELAVESSDEWSVTLYWRASDEATAINLVDQRRGKSAFALVPGECALDALRHPCGYLRARSGAAELESGPVDVDELWLSELAASMIAGLVELLARQPDAGR
jgi:hypothetical protein